MKSLMKAMLLVLLATPAYSQAMNMNLFTDPGKIKTQEEADREKARDNAYQSAIKKLPNQNTKADPWGNMRAPQGNQARSNPK